MIPRLRGAAAVLLALVLAITMVGCGSRRDDLEKLTAKQLLAETKKAALAADAVTLQGDAGEVKIKLGYTGARLTGTMTVNGGKLDILRTGGTTYIRGSDAYWRATVGDDADRVIGLARGRWVQVDPEDENFEDLTTLASRTKVLEEFLGGDLKVTPGKARKVDGVECLAVTIGQDTLYLAADDARPLELRDSADGAAKASKASTLRFSYDDVTVPAKPAASDIMQSAELLG